MVWRGDVDFDLVPGQSLRAVRSLNVSVAALPWRTRRTRAGCGSARHRGYRIASCVRGGEGEVCVRRCPEGPLRRLAAPETGNLTSISVEVCISDQVSITEFCLTLSPLLTRTRPTTPSLGDLSSFCIFIDFEDHQVLPLGDLVALLNRDIDDQAGHGRLELVLAGLCDVAARCLSEQPLALILHRDFVELAPEKHVEPVLARADVGLERAISSKREYTACSATA